MGIPKYLKNEPNVCPMCEEDCEIVDSGIEDGCAYTKCYCPKCDIEWEENFSIEYCGYNLRDEDGNMILYDHEGKEI